MAERVGLKPIQCEFESHRGYAVSRKEYTMLNSWDSVPFLGLAVLFFLVGLLVAGIAMWIDRQNERDWIMPQNSRENSERDNDAAGA
jgi:hypothetical protein